MEAWAFVKLLLTILTPILGLGIGVWLNKKKEDLRHGTMDEVDANLQAHLEGDPHGLAHLTRQLERLHREARRKTGHSR